MDSAQISVGNGPVFIGSSDGDDVYVANSESGTISVIDPDTNICGTEHNSGGTARSYSVSCGSCICSKLWL